MQRHSKRSVRSRSHSPRGKRQPSSRSALENAIPCAGFLSAWQELLGVAPLLGVGKRRGRKPRVPLVDLLSALIFHVMNQAGTLAEHFGMLFEDSLNESGCAAFAAPALKACRRVGSEFLFRARTQIKVQVVRRFKDGSRLVRVPVRQKGKPHRIVEWLELREIRVRLHRQGHRSTELRLWTSLLDPNAAPAAELVELYAKRWEHELFYRELKRQLRKSALLQSHTVVTAAQEIAALMLAAALLAKERDRAAAGQVPVLRVSFSKLLELIRPLWLTLALADDVLEEWQKQELTQRFYRKAGMYVTPKRRARSCPRKVRQPVSGWPRLMRNEYGEGPATFSFIQP